MKRFFTTLEIVGDCGRDFEAMTRKEIEPEKSVRKFGAVDLNEPSFALGDVAGFFSATAHSSPNQALQPTAAAGRG